jgi:hypothetical protein
MTEVKNLADLINKHSSDSDWSSPAFSRALSDAIFYGFKISDADIIMVKWKMLGDKYDHLSASNVLTVPVDQSYSKWREAYQSREIFHWTLDQQNRMRTKDDAIKRTAEISKEEYFGMLSSANSIQGDGNE